MGSTPVHPVIPKVYTLFTRGLYFKTTFFWKKYATKTTEALRASLPFPTIGRRVAFFTHFAVSGGRYSVALFLLLFFHTEVGLPAVRIT